jgi:hypothetical protein
MDPRLFHFLRWLFFRPDGKLEALLADRKTYFFAQRKVTALSAVCLEVSRAEALDYGTYTMSGKDRHHEYLATRRCTEVSREPGLAIITRPVGPLRELRLVLLDCVVVA